MKLALNQAQKIAIAFAVAVVGIGLAGPSSAGEELYYYNDAKGVFRFTREPVPGAKPFRPGLLEDRAPVTASKAAVAEATIPPPGRARRAASNTAYDHIIGDYADRFGVDTALVKAIIHAESTFRPKARSRAGARGLMQLLPSTAGMYGVASGDLYVPHSNIRAGVLHLRSLLETFAGNVRLAVAAYNAGEGAVRRHGGLPPFRETRNYVRKVLLLRARYADEVRVAIRNPSDERKKLSPS